MSGDPGRDVGRGHWWDRLPDPAVRLALRSWARLPEGVRSQLARLTPVINPGATEVAEVPPGPDVVAGVTQARADGFTPIEELTGRLEIVTVWPPAHRRSVVETRAWWLEDSADGLLWLVRSPWPAIRVEDAVSVVWLHLERDRGSSPDDLDEARDVLLWPEAQASATLARHRLGT